jgi:hypothetical protein
MACRSAAANAGARRVALAGSAANPALARETDTHTGLYWIGANNLGVATNGVLRLDVANARITAAVPVRLRGYTVATLPAGVVGDTAYVTDALAPAFLTAVVGGWAVVTPVFYNGAAWVAH